MKFRKTVTYEVDLRDISYDLTSTELNNLRKVNGVLSGEEPYNAGYMGSSPDPNYLYDRQPVVTSPPSPPPLSPPLLLPPASYPLEPQGAEPFVPPAVTSFPEPPLSEPPQSAIETYPTAIPNYSDNKEEGFIEGNKVIEAVISLKNRMGVSMNENPLRFGLTAGIPFVVGIFIWTYVDRTGFTFNSVEESVGETEVVVEGDQTDLPPLPSNPAAGTFAPWVPDDVKPSLSE